jgi:hypothetical protein
VQYAQREDFFDLCEKDRPLAEAAEALDSSEWEAALSIAGPWVERCPVDIDGRLASAIALKQLGRALDAEEHVRWYQGLVAAVLATGDGRSAKTAFVVLSVPEEYAILRAFGLEPVRQALLEGGIDQLTARDDQGAVHTLYFYPEAHWRRLERTFP